MKLHKPGASLTREQALQYITYDPETGVMRNACSRSKVRKGDVAGHVNGKGYYIVCIASSSYLAHRVAWLIHYGEWPKHHIDHINGSRADNRISNMRDVPQGWNVENVVSAQINSSTGIRGVGRRGARYIAQIQSKRKTLFLGTFDTPEEAHSAYLDAKQKLHGGFIGDRK